MHATRIRDLSTELLRVGLEYRHAPSKVCAKDPQTRRAFINEKSRPSRCPPSTIREVSRKQTRPTNPIQAQTCPRKGKKSRAQASPSAVTSTRPYLADPQRRPIRPKDPPHRSTLIRSDRLLSLDETPAPKCKQTEPTHNYDLPPPKHEMLGRPWHR